MRATLNLQGVQKNCVTFFQRQAYSSQNKQFFKNILNFSEFDISAMYQVPESFKLTLDGMSIGLSASKGKCK